MLLLKILYCYNCFKVMAKKVLIVDDEVDLARLLQMNLILNGYEVLIANTGRQGIQLAASSKPDLIILDISLPDMDGLRICEALKQAPLTREIPILMCTVKRKVKEVNKAFSLGASGYIIKPFKIENVIQKIKEVI